MLKNLFFILVCFLFIQGCAASEDGKSNQSSDDHNYGTIDSYFPFESNVKYTYGNSMGDQYSYTVYNTYVNDNVVQRIMSASFGDGTEVIQKNNGEIKLVYGDPGFYFYEDITNAIPNTDILILKEPLKLGNKWQYSEGVQSEITSMSTQVETPAGIFNAIEVTNTGDNGSIEKSYYAEDIGLVKLTALTTSGETIDFSIELLSYEKEIPFEITKDFYLYNVEIDEVVLEPRTLNIYTNINYYELLETEMKRDSDNNLALLTENTKINGLNINRQASSLVLDLSDNFIEELNVGAHIEEILINCIVNTIGNFYDVKQVSITIDGNKYESGHIIIETDEYIDVEL